MRGHHGATSATKRLKDEILPGPQLGKMCFLHANGSKMNLTPQYGEQKDEQVTQITSSIQKYCEVLMLLPSSIQNICQYLCPHKALPVYSTTLSTPKNSRAVLAAWYFRLSGGNPKRRLASFSSKPSVSWRT